MLFATVADGNSMNLNIPKNRPNVGRNPKYQRQRGIFGDHNFGRIVTGGQCKINVVLGVEKEDSG